MKLRLATVTVATTVAVLVTAGNATAVPPELVSVGHVKRHPAAIFSAPRAETVLVYIAKSPERATDGSFFSENVVVLDSMTAAEMSTGRWVYESRLAPGTYYAMLLTSPEQLCFSEPPPTYDLVVDPSCTSGSSEVVTFTIEAPPRPPRYVASLGSIHRGAISVPWSKRVWTYPGDTLRVAFRNAALAPGNRQSYRVCYQHGSRRAICRNRTLRGPGTDAFRVRVLRWVSCRGGSVRKPLRFTWKVGAKTVATKKAWLYECV